MFVLIPGLILHSYFEGRKIINTHFFSTINLISILKKKKLKRYDHIGTCDEYGDNISPIKENVREDPITSYAFGKLASINLLIMLYKTENFLCMYLLT